MKAVVQDTYGAPEVLRLDEVERPAIGAGEVLVEVRAAGVDRGAWHLMTGRPYLVRLAFGLRRPRQRVRGFELAGRVEAVGEGVTRFAPGDAVFGVGHGAFAEYARARADKLAPVPANLSMEQAATLPVSGTTALQAVRDAGRLRSGERVLIIGASGGVGSLALQIAKALGASEVVGVCSAGKADLVSGLGADRVIDYAREEIGDDGRTYDLVIDAIGKRPLGVMRRALTPRGRLVLVGAEGAGAVLGGLERMLWAKLLSLWSRQSLRALVATERREDLEQLATLVEGGRIAPVLERAWPLAEAAAAMWHLAQGRARGKVVLTP